MNIIKMRFENERTNKRTKKGMKEQNSINNLELATTCSIIPLNIKSALGKSTW